VYAPGLGIALPAVPAVIGAVSGIVRGIFGGGVSAAERAQHTANLQTLYNQALGGDSVALCRLQAAGGLLGSSGGSCGGTSYGRFGDMALREEAARLYYQVTQGGGVARPLGGGFGGIGTGTLLALGAAALVIPLVLRRRR